MHRLCKRFRFFSSVKLKYDTKTARYRSIEYLAKVHIETYFRNNLLFGKFVLPEKIGNGRAKLT
jgi:hypothetical protein